MGDSIGLIIQLAIFLFLIGMGFFVGRTTERRHIRSLDQREAANGDFFIGQANSIHAPSAGSQPPMLVIGEAVIATDYLKSFLAGLRKIFGGELKSYETLLTRARREALQRLVDEAREQGFNAVCNLRFETADVGGNTSAKKVATVAILASATAYQRA